MKTHFLKISFALWNHRKKDILKKCEKEIEGTVSARIRFDVGYNVLKYNLFLFFTKLDFCWKSGVLLSESNGIVNLSLLRTMA